MRLAKQRQIRLDNEHLFRVKEFPFGCLNSGHSSTVLDVVSSLEDADLVATHDKSSVLVVTDDEIRISLTIILRT